MHVFKLICWNGSWSCALLVSAQFFFLKKLCLTAITETTSKYENFAVVVGLGDGPNTAKDVVKINLQKPNDITTLEQIPTTMKNEAIAAVYDNTMYVAGIGVKCDEIWKYNQTSGWKQCAYL